MRSENEPGGQPTRTFIEEARRAQIVSCAIDTIAELGYAKGSLAQIAKRAGISKGVISYHFAGKDELIEQVVVGVYQLGAELMLPRIMAETTWTGRLRTYVRSNAEFIRDHPKQLAALVEIFVNRRTPDGELHYRDTGDENILQPLVDLLTGGQQDGEFRDFDPRAMAMMIRDLIDGISSKTVYRPGFDVDSYTTELLRLIDSAVLTP